MSRMMLVGLALVGWLAAASFAGGAHPVEGPTVKVTVTLATGGETVDVALRLADGDEGPVLHLSPGRKHSTSWGPDAGPKSTFSAAVRQDAGVKDKYQVSGELVLNERGESKTWYVQESVPAGQAAMMTFGMNAGTLLMAPQETAAVTVKGLECTLWGPVVWPGRGDDTGTPISLTLKIVNTTDEVVTLEREDGPTVILKDSNGRVLEAATGADATPRPGSVPAHQPMTLTPKGQAMMTVRAQLRRTDEKNQTWWLAGANGDGFWRYDGLKPGHYTVALNYKQSAAQDGKAGGKRWSGEITTKELAVELTAPKESK